MTPDTAIATAADYADAMMTARRAKNVLLLLLILVLLGELALFFVMRFTDFVTPGAEAAATQPVLNRTDCMHYLLGGCLFLGVTTSIVLSFVLLLIANIMLVGRLIGVARVTGAYVLCLVVLVLLFPWQAFLSNAGMSPDQPVFKVPGVLFTWPELANPVTGAKFANAPFFPEAFLRWARFVAFPLVAIILLLIIQSKTNRGMRQALGEDQSPPPPGETTI